ncbi:MAG: 8-amino-7-oxononanoate synthase [Zoogloeaceae bacterium]|jgi:8-amino-7-oxononanoate synthase|nr:8-amino-7-oxononanoate synthase [Zoogloeaceae bacterium]
MSDFSLAQPLRDALFRLESEGQRRRRIVADSAVAPRMTVAGQPVLAFASNDYLGLADHPEIKAAFAEAVLRWGAGSGASHLVSGHLWPHEALEAQLARFVGFERALTFSSGYLANLAVTPTLAAGRADAIFADKLNHASLIDAMALTRAEHHRYPHGDTAALEKLLAASSATTKLIVTDAVFSMDGDLAPLPELFDLAERYDAWLVVDDAHGFGVLGEKGRGSLSHFGLPAHPRLVLMGTLGKAAGVSGAFVAASATVIDYLIQKARSYIFTTAQPPACAAALLASLALIEAADDRRAQLQRLIAQLQRGLADTPLRLVPSPTAIQPVIVGENDALLRLSQKLWERGLWVGAIRPPTVPKGTSRLRISLCAAHQEEDLARLIDALREECL